MIYLTCLETHSSSSHYFARYKKLVTYYLENEPTDSFHKHHIAPRGIFPEYEDDSENLVKLPVRAHFIAHYLLAKFTRHTTQIFAFNMMRKYSKNSKMYEAFDVEIRKAISEANTGRAMGESQRKNLSKVNAGMVNARFKDGSVQKVSVNDSRFVSGEIVNARVGYVHSDETKQKMSDNGIKGHSPKRINGVVKYKYDESDLVGADITEVWDESARKNISEKVSNLRWVTENGVSRRVPREEVVDNTSKRVFDNPFSKENMGGKKFVYCLKEKKKIIVAEHEDAPHWIKHAEKTTNVYVYDNVVGVGLVGIDYFRRKFGITGSANKKICKELFLKGIALNGVVCYNILSFVWKEEYTLCQKLKT